MGTMSTMTTMTSEKSTEELLQEKLDARKKNRENISLADLKGKYKKSYDKLVNEIYVLMYQFMEENLFNFWVGKETKAAARTMMREQLDAKERDIKTALWKHSSASEYGEIIAAIRSEVLDSCFSAIDKEAYTVNPMKPEKMILTEMDGRSVFIRSIDSQ